MFWAHNIPAVALLFDIGQPANRVVNVIVLKIIGCTALGTQFRPIAGCIEDLVEEYNRS